MVDGGSEEALTISQVEVSLVTSAATVRKASAVVQSANSCR